jgi:hypothetical protein
MGLQMLPGEEHAKARSRSPPARGLEHRAGSQVAAPDPDHDQGVDLLAHRCRVFQQRREAPAFPGKIDPAQELTSLTASLADAADRFCNSPRPERELRRLDQGAQPFRM